MNIEALREQFDELGVNTTEDVLEKCKNTKFIIKIIYFFICQV